MANSEATPMLGTFMGHLYPSVLDLLWKKGTTFCRQTLAGYLRGNLPPLFGSGIPSHDLLIAVTDPVGEQDAIEMVHLVLDNAGMNAIEISRMPASPLVLPSNADPI